MFFFSIILIPDFFFFYRNPSVVNEMCNIQQFYSCVHTQCMPLGQLTKPALLCRNTILPTQVLAFNRLHGCLTRFPVDSLIGHHTYIKGRVRSVGTHILIVYVSGPFEVDRHSSDDRSICWPNSSSSRICQLARAKRNSSA